jgi:hypothetical protein
MIGTYASGPAVAAPPGVVTVTVTVPEPAGAVTTISLALSEVTVAASPLIALNRRSRQYSPERPSRYLV